MSELDDRDWVDSLPYIFGYKDNHFCWLSYQLSKARLISTFF